MPLPDKVFNVLLDGLSELALLRLPDHPPAKALPAVALVWEKVLVKAAEWSDEDAGRLAAAFTVFSANAERFPLPKDILHYLPPRPLPPPLPAPDPAPCPPEIKAQLDALTAGLLINKKTEV